MPHDISLAESTAQCTLSVVTGAVVDAAARHLLAFTKEGCNSYHALDLGATQQQGMKKAPSKGKLQGETLWQNSFTRSTKPLTYTRILAT